MYLQGLQEAENSISKYINHVASAKHAGAFSTNLEEINSSVQVIIEQMTLSHEAKATLVPGAGLDEDMKDQLYSLLKQIRYDLDEGSDVTDSRKKLAEFSKVFVMEENKKWKNAVEEKANAQVSLLIQLKDVTEDPAATTSIISSLKANASQMPKDIKGIINYEKILQNADNIIKSIGATPHIMSFIRKVASGQAYLSDLDDEVSSWIREHKLQDSIRLGFYTKY